MGKYLHKHDLNLLKLRHDLKGILEPLKYSMSLVKEDHAESALAIQTEIYELLTDVVSELKGLSTAKIELLEELEPSNLRGS